MTSTGTATPASGARIERGAERSPAGPRSTARRSDGSVHPDGSVIKERHGLCGMPAIAAS
jgi:hypothetical protein